MPSPVQPPITPYTRPTAKRAQRKKTATKDAVVRAVPLYAALTAELTAERDHYYLAVIGDLVAQRGDLTSRLRRQEWINLSLLGAVTSLATFILLFCLHR